MMIEPTEQWQAIYSTFVFMGLVLGGIAATHVYYQRGSVINAFGSFILGPTFAVIASAIVFSWVN